jgi:hypothetical protein
MLGHEMQHLSGSASAVGARDHGPGNGPYLVTFGHNRLTQRLTGAYPDGTGQGMTWP